MIPCKLELAFIGKIFTLLSLCSVLLIAEVVCANESEASSPHADKSSNESLTEVNTSSSFIADNPESVTAPQTLDVYASVNHSAMFRSCQQFGWIDSEAKYDRNYTPAASTPPLPASTTPTPPPPVINLCYNYDWTVCRDNAAARNISYELEETCYPRIEHCAHSFCYNSWFLLEKKLDGWLNNLMRSGCSWGRNGRGNRNVGECKYARGTFSTANMVVTSDRPFDFSRCDCDGILCNKKYNDTGDVRHNRMKYWGDDENYDLYAIPVDNDTTTTNTFAVEQLGKYEEGEKVKGKVWTTEFIGSFIANILLLMVVVALMAALTSIRSSQRNDNSCKASYSTASPPDTSISSEDRNVPEIDIDFSTTTPIKQGRFGKLYVLPKPHNGYKCLVKVSEKIDIAAWGHERAIYEHPGIQHENIVKYFGASSSTELCLVLQYHTRGSLQDYLKGHTLTWDEALLIMHSTMKGLSHLHEVIRLPSGEIKQPIAHRDIKSNNIMLDDKLCAKIGDFNLAQILPSTSLTDADDPRMKLRVGTIRYMAPEVLSGQINYTRAAVLQTDVYAAGLVLWEVFSRYEHSLSGYAEHKHPYHEYVNEAPLMEEMCAVVCKDQKRPEFAAHDDNPVISELISTIQGSWEAEGDARLTARCIEVRLQSMLSGNNNMAYDNSDGHVYISM